MRIIIGLLMIFCWNSFFILLWVHILQCLSAELVLLVLGRGQALTTQRLKRSQFLRRMKPNHLWKHLNLMDLMGVGGCFHSAASELERKEVVLPLRCLDL